MGLFASWPSDAGRPRLRRYGARGVVSFMVAFRPGRSLPRVRPGLSPRLAHDGKPTELRSTRARGRVSQISAGRTTDALRRLDIRECARSGVLRPGYACRWIWRRGGKVTGTVNLLALDDRLILSYRHRSIGGEWQDETYPASSHAPLATMAARGRGLCARWTGVAAASPSSMAPRSLLAGAPIALPMPGRQRGQPIELPDVPTESGTG
jgi:hypothetical protein